MTSNNDIFESPIACEEPPSLFKRINHNLVPKGCNYGENNEPIQTNNFYNNLTLDDQTWPIWTQPYSLWLTRNSGQDVGLAFNHTEASQRVYGPDPNSDPVQFFFNPPKIKSFVISGENFDNASLQLENHNKLSVVSKLMINNDKYVTIPLVQGMGFITAIYNNIKPMFHSDVGFQEFSQVESIGNINKYKIKLFNQVTWTLYVQGDCKIVLRDSNHIIGDKEGKFVFQFCRGESKYYDESAGCYPIAAHIHGNINNDKGRYKFVYDIEGKSKSGNSIVWCLPHHQESLIDEIKNKSTNLKLDSTTKGVMEAYNTNELIMEESLPIDINWDPWASFATKPVNYSNEVKELIRKSAEKDINQNVAMSDTDSMYFSGKILDKFAYILYVCHFILKDDNLTSRFLPKVKEAIEKFASNRQIFPLVYDTTWKGLISSAEPGADFGNSNYNDHHFHYGYHIHAIALVAKVDESWLYSNDNLVLNYANSLLRDVASPKADKYFPQSRSFDWFHGHSFARGIFGSGDGKDEESSSEDYHFAYGMKLYAKVVKDANMEHRANLMLAIMKRSLNMYMLFSNDNKVQPKNFIKNKVSGILFENKIDYATYFGRGNIENEWIHGIHMLPITPISSYMRNENFVKEEWEQKFADIIDKISDGWKGILMLNLALYDPKKAWKWFSRDDWDHRQIDSGMSRTWSLSFIAGIGGAN